MFKYLLVTVSIIAFASAAFAFDGTVCIGPIDTTGAAPTSTTYVPTPSGHRDVIYDDQTYDYGDLVCAHNIHYYGEGGYKVADDFEVYDYWTLEMVRVWLLNSEAGDMLVEVFGDAGDIPDDDDLLYSETISDGDYTWTATGDMFYGYQVYEVEIPINGFDISPGNMYWLSLQHQGGLYIFWCAVHCPLPDDWWDVFALYFGGAWIDGWYYCGNDQFFELHGIVDIVDYNDPDVTQTHPHDSDFPSGVPVGTDVTFHVTDDVSGCDTDDTICTVEENGGPLLGGLTFDDSEPLDVAFEWEPDDYYAEWTDVDVTVETYDLAGNGPVTEEWSFATGYTNVAPASLGVIKAGFIE